MAESATADGAGSAAVANSEQDAKPQIEWATLKEGKAEVLHLPGEAFYNPAQVQNRDLSVAVLREFHKICEAESAERKGSSKAQNQMPPYDGLRVLEGLSATGLRAVRYAKEIDGIKEVLANDFSSAAVDSIKRNIDHNSVGDKVKPSHADASLLMYQSRETQERFHVVDLDPYGSAAPFLDGAVQSVHEGGLLAVTCTDLAVLCGNHSEACHSKYGCTSLRGKHCHEFALRIVLSCVETHANRYRRHVEPLLSVHMDFYVRLFLRVYTSPQNVKKSASKQAMVYQCNGCGVFHLQPLGKIVEKGNSVKYLPGLGPPCGEVCEHCGHKHQIGGPIWTDPISNLGFVEAVKKQLTDNQADFASYKRIFGIVTALSEELPFQPLFYDLSVLSRHLNASCPSNAAFSSALLNAGYAYSHSHTCPTAFKTDAPPHALWDIMRAWVKLHPVKTPKEGSPAAALLAKENTLIPAPDFTVRPELKKDSFAPKPPPKYVPNPQPEWGPMQRAAGYSTGGVSLSGKRERNQGKNAER